MKYRNYKAKDRIKKMNISSADFDAHPEKVSKKITLSNGQEVLLRPLRTDDASILGAYFLTLSQETRNLFAPHPFDQATAEMLCAQIDSTREMRLLAIVNEGGTERVAAYFITLFYVYDGDGKRYNEWGIPLNDKTDCQIAPSAADDYQGTGLGSMMMDFLVDIFRALGYKRMVLLGGVRQHNEQAIRFYKRFGFRTVAEFTTKAPNYHMIANL